MRKPPLNEVPPIEPDPGKRNIQVREYKLITPLFGGGVSPAEADPVTLIRGTEIRGHLRFWWRATRGGKFNGDLSAMKAAEADLWGAASTKKDPRPSKIQIDVKVLSAGQEDKPFEIVADKHGGPDPKSRRGSVVPEYAAFPLKPEKNKATFEMETKSVRVGVTFELTISYLVDKLSAEQQQDLQAALWAWETFGGIGARTRRGFGALQCTKIDDQPVTPPSCPQVKQHLLQQMKTHVAAGMWPKDLPGLSQSPKLVVVGHFKDDLEAWRILIRGLKDFRQSRNPGTQPNRPGRSRWPEPDAIRRKMGQRSRHHTTPLSTVDKFPRAEFGLPIVFHFKDNDDPAQTSLQGGPGYDRLASPLILRPLRCDKNQSVGLALILEAPRIPPGGLTLAGAPPGTSSVNTNKLTGSEANAIPVLNGNPNILEAFLDYLQRRHHR